MSDPLYLRKWAGTRFFVYADRIEYHVALNRPLVVPLSEIQSLEMDRSNRVVLTTTAGQQHLFPVGLPADAQQVIQAVEAARAPLTAGQPAPLQTRVKEYKTAKEFEADAAQMQAAGWRLESQVAQAGHINVGRTATGAVLTGGLSLLLGASRTKDKITVTWLRGGEAATKACPQCAEEVKAAAKVCRFCQYSFE